MAIEEAAFSSPRGPCQALAGLFDEAWRHGHKRQARYLMMLLVGVATAITLVATQIGGASRSGAGIGSTKVPVDRYEVCASNIDGIWRYTYGAGCVASNEPTKLPYTYGSLVIPARSKVEVIIAQSPAVHSVRFRGLALTLRAGTQSTVETSFRTPQAGETYSGECTAECGHDPEFAGTTVTVVSPERYEHWVATHAEAISKQNKQASQLRTELIQQHVFASNAPR